MISYLVLLKSVHVALALGSGVGFALRGVWMLRDSELLQTRWVRTAPHVLDTLLLASGIGLAVGFGVSPLVQPWLAAKLALLLLYIAAGAVALRRGRTRRTRILALAVALALYALIVLSAVTRRALGIL